MVVIFDLGFRERGLLHRAPHHRAQPAIQRAVHQEAPDLARDHRFGGEVHRGIAPHPVARDAKPLELLRLHIQPARGIGAAFGAEIEDRDIVLVLLPRAVFFLDLPFDRQAVAVPAGHVVGVEACHLRRAVDDVLQHLVQRVADMDVAIGIGRAVMQDELRPSGGLRPQPVPQAHPVPARQPIGLALRQVAAHREVGLRQDHRAAIVAGGWGLGRIGHGCGSRAVRRGRKPRGRQDAGIVPAFSGRPGC